MGKIKVLPEAVANRIAAGEVIERPSSIVKELIENSLDAGAKSIEVAIRHGGKSLIRITDDGHGMSAEDVELAFLRHATSKIANAKDLDRIASFGFRGEALPSIAAVSRTKVMTRAKGAEVGTELVIEGGRTVSVKECPCREGTTIEIRDLFFNTPARRKFMRTDSTENGHVVDMVSNLALSHLETRFLLKSADKTLYDLLPNETPQRRAEMILGEKTAKHLMPIEGKSGNIRIKGLIAKPLAARANRMGQTVFVNGRWVKALPFSFALQEGYRGFLMHGQFPVAILFLELDPETVDVNVHPTKQEVRISGAPQLMSLIKKTVAKCLSEEPDLSPQVRIPDLENFPTTPSASSSGSFPPTTHQQSFIMSTDSTESPQTDIGSLPVQEDRPLDDLIVVKNRLKITKILGQIHNTFIVAETEDGLMMIDQHAAHEKIQYEALMKSFKQGKPVSQKLLMDEVIELSPKHSQILEGQIEFLQKLGFEIDSFGKDSFVIRSIPSVFNKESPVAVIQQFIEEKEEGKLGTSLENQSSEIAALLACKTKSVRAHDPLTYEAMCSLVEQLSECEQPFSCPHGRPSILRQTFEDLEKQFKRKL